LNRRKRRREAIVWVAGNRDGKRGEKREKTPRKKVTEVS